jgi:hypothetical protein
MNHLKKLTKSAIGLVWILLLCLTGLAAGQQLETMYTIPQLQDGYVPMDVTQGPDKNWYGETWVGGNSACVSGCGVVYQLVPTTQGWKENVIHAFSGQSDDGLNPTGGLVFDSKGNLYGSAPYGGIYSQGVVFELSPPTSKNGQWTEKILHQFGGPGDGIQPWGHLYLHNGNLIGMTPYGGGSSCGGYGCGTVFEVSPNPSGGWTESIIYNFNDESGAFGAYPNPGLIPANPAAHGPEFIPGALYGTAASSFLGDSQTGGVVFQLVPPLPGGAWSVKLLHTFPYHGGPNQDGFGPAAGVIMDAHGNLFGTTVDGGSSSSCQFWSCGAVYELKPSSELSQPWTEMVIHSFAGPPADGLNPRGFMVADESGNLYGLTPYGGNSQACGGVGCGVVFKLVNVNDSWTESIVNFNGGNGWFPNDQLVLGEDGSLYGTAESAYPDYYGLVFRVSP